MACLAWVAPWLREEWALTTDSTWPYPIHGSGELAGVHYRLNKDTSQKLLLSRMSVCGDGGGGGAEE